MSYAEHAQLADVFQAHYGLRPVAVARAPGNAAVVALWKLGLGMGPSSQVVHVIRAGESDRGAH